MQDRKSVPYFRHYGKCTRNDNMFRKSAQKRKRGIDAMLFR